MKLRMDRLLLLFLGLAIGVGPCIACADGVAADAAQKQVKLVRTTVTGSNIVRYRTQDSLPLLELDKAYIDQTGTTTAPALIQTVPQTQNLGNSGAVGLPQRH